MTEIRLTITAHENNVIIEWENSKGKILGKTTITIFPDTNLDEYERVAESEAAEEQFEEDAVEVEKLLRGEVVSDYQMELK